MIFFSARCLNLTILTHPLSDLSVHSSFKYVLLKEIAGDTQLSDILLGTFGMLARTPGSPWTPV